MNMHNDLIDELERLAKQQAPPPETIRSELEARDVRHDKRRRNTLWIAAAAAVALVVGSVPVLVGTLQDNDHIVQVASSDAQDETAAEDGSQSMGTLAEEDLDTDASKAVSDHADSGEAAFDDSGSDDSEVKAEVINAELMPYQGETVTSPVTVEPPQGLTARTWQHGTAGLSVTFLDQGALDQSRDEAAADPENDPSIEIRQVGYVITADFDDDLTVFESGAAAEDVVRSSYEIAGHDATLQTAPHGTVGAFGTSARERLIWQLSDGSWIHLWTAMDDAGQESPSRSLQEFARSVIEQPQVLEREFTVDLTLTGFENPFWSKGTGSGDSGSSLFLCRDGYDPMSAAAQGNTDAPCVSVSVRTFPEEAIPQLVPGTPVPIDGQTVHIADRHEGFSAAAWTQPAKGLVAFVSIPSAVELSDSQFAQLVASVRLTI